jgi:uncharacterized protein (TIGR02597 family)
MPRLILSLLACAACLQISQAQTSIADVSSTDEPQSVTSDPVGFNAATTLANSDTLLSIPFTRPPEFSGTIQSVSGNVITVQGTPGWSANQFVYVAGSQPKTYYVLIGAGGTSNPREGHIYTVTGNDSNALTVNINADTLTGVTASTQVIVIPYWTPATIFPAADANRSFTPTTSTASYKTQVVVTNNAAFGTKGYSTTYFFSNNVNGTSGNIGWRVAGNDIADRGDDPLLPNNYFVVRNQNGAPTLTLKGLGAVLTRKFATPLRTSVTGTRDNAVSMVRPVAVKLSETGLGPEDGSFVASPPIPPTRGSRLNVKDQLLLFDNSQVAFNKQPSAVYYYYAGNPAGWKLLGDDLVDHGQDLIPAGSAIVIRKATTADGATVFWTNTASY